MQNLVKANTHEEVMYVTLLIELGIQPACKVVRGPMTHRSYCDEDWGPGAY